MEQGTDRYYFLLQISSYEVPMNNAALNHGDVYILDKGMTVYQWQGGGSTGMERNRAGTVVRAIDDDRKSNVEVIVLDLSPSAAVAAARCCGAGSDRTCLSADARGCKPAHRLTPTRKDTHWRMLQLAARR